MFKVVKKLGKSWNSITKVAEVVVAVVVVVVTHSPLQIDLKMLIETNEGFDSQWTFFAVAVVVAFRKLKILIFLSCEKKLKYFNLHSILLHLVVFSEVVAKASQFFKNLQKNFL